MFHIFIGYQDSFDLKTVPTASSREKAVAKFYEIVTSLKSEPVFKLGDIKMEGPLDWKIQDGSVYFNWNPKFEEKRNCEITQVFARSSAGQTCTGVIIENRDLFKGYSGYFFFSIGLDPEEVKEVPLSKLPIVSSIPEAMAHFQSQLVNFYKGFSGLFDPKLEEIEFHAMDGKFSVDLVKSILYCPFSYGKKISLEEADSKICYLYYGTNGGLNTDIFACCIPTTLPFN